jgi:hypothetical protein
MAVAIFNDHFEWNYAVVAGTSGADTPWAFTDENGDPIDLSVFTEVRAEWRTSYPQEEPAFTLTTEDGSIVNGGALGTLTITHDTDATAALMEALGHKKQSYKYDLIGYHTNGKDLIFRGTVLLEPNATREDGS